jgi:hypothetical protein
LDYGRLLLSEVLVYPLHLRLFSPLSMLHSRFSEQLHCVGSIFASVGYLISAGQSREMMCCGWKLDLSWCVVPNVEMYPELHVRLPQGFWLSLQ